MALTFRAYLDRRLGTTSARQRWSNFFIRPFGAGSFVEFWRLWNPVYGYFLLRYVYRPASRRIGRPLAAMLTFLVCGFVLHDLPAWIFVRRTLPPGATIAFALFGIVAIASEAVGFDMSRWPTPARAFANVTYLVCCVGAMLWIVSRLV